MMKDMISDRAGLIGCAIGTAVIELVANGITITQGNVLYELERLAQSSKDIEMRAIALDAARLLRSKSPRTD